MFSFAAILALGDQGLRAKLPTNIIFTAAAPIGAVPVPSADKTTRCFGFLAGAASGLPYLLLITADNRSPNVSLLLHQLSLNSEELEASPCVEGGGGGEGVEPSGGGGGGGDGGGDGGEGALSAPTSLLCYTHGARTLVVWSGVTGHTSVLALSRPDTWAADLTVAPAEREREKDRGDRPRTSSSRQAGSRAMGRGGGGGGRGGVESKVVRGVLVLMTSPFEANLVGFAFGFRIYGLVLGFRGWGLGLRVWGLGVWGL